MTFETKYGLGDGVWMMHKDKVAEYQVRAISIHACISDGRSAVGYEVFGPGGEFRIVEGINEFFATKAELLASL